MSNDIILKQSIKDNPLYVYMEETMKCLVYSLIHNVKIIKVEDFSSAMIHAGDVYNNLYMSEQLISDDNFKKILTDFKMITETNQKLKNYVLEDPATNMFEMCCFFFIPVRFDTNTLPDAMKYKFLKTFITTITILEFNAMYLSKYSTAINSIQTLQKIIDMISNNNGMADKIEKLQEKYVFDSLGNIFNNQNSTQIFIRTFGMVLLQMFIEIIKRWNPVIQECVKINPNYNGEWINPFDPMFNEQIGDIRKIEKVCKV